APGIGGAVTDDLEDLTCRLIAPDAAVNPYAFIVGRSGRADLRVRDDSVTAIQPTVRPPGEAIDDIMSRVGAETVEHNDRLRGRRVGIFLERDVKEMRGTERPDAAVAVL